MVNWIGCDLNLTKNLPRYSHNPPQESPDTLLQLPHLTQAELGHITKVGD